MKTFVLGSGAREHAIVAALARDESVTAIVTAPGNPGMEPQARRVELSGPLTDPAAVVRAVIDAKPDLVVIGPEAPLVSGVADALRAKGWAVFGPSAAAARIEGSKAFAKDIMTAAGVPTARSAVCANIDEVAQALDEFGAPHVVKDDGLAAGKGVVVTSQRTQALAHAAQCLARTVAPGESAPTVVVEEFLDGPEVSLFCVTDGTTVVPLQPAQDSKRLRDHDEGPNTGGMGAYSPLTWAPADMVEDIVRTAARPTIDELRRRGTPFVGVLYCGLALTAQGPKVIEFNARFGDPETQVVLGRLRSPLGKLLLAAATGKLAEHPPLEWSDDSCVTVVVAAKGYPEGPRKDDVITGVDDANAVEGVEVLHAGTRTIADGQLVSYGGRVLSVTALGSTLTQARERAYQGVAAIALEGSQHRTDIGAKAERGEVTIPVGQQEGQASA